VHIDFTWKFGARIIWYNGRDHKDSDRTTPRIEFSGYIVESLGDEHVGESYRRSTINDQVLSYGPHERCTPQITIYGHNDLAKFLPNFIWLAPDLLVTMYGEGQA
jgi:hypothetical protein